MTNSRPPHDWTETISGEEVDLTTPSTANIRLDDIARSLSRIARFNGHTLGDEPYNVALHSVWVAEVLEAEFESGPLTALFGLLHDAHEAYTGDITSPVKRTIGHAGIAAIQGRLQQVIHVALGLPDVTGAQARLIAKADQIALVAEAKVLMRSGGARWGYPPPPDWAVSKVFPCLHAKRSEAMFLETYNRLASECARTSRTEMPLYLNLTGGP